MTLQKMVSDTLKRTAILSWFLKLIKIPVTILSAQLTANVIRMATNGEIISLLYTSAALLALVIGIQIFNLIMDIIYQKCLSRSLHKCKINLYRQFLSNPLSSLFSSQYGDSMEKLNDDFNTVTGKRTSLYPEFWTSIIIAVTYFIFIAIQNLWIAILLFAFSLMQIIPPIMIKKKVQTYYSQNRDIEAELTDYIVNAYRGFSLIKLYGLKQWWLNGLSQLHKEYMKVGSRAEASYTTETSMTNLVDNILQYGTYITVGIFILFRYAALEVGVQAITLSGEFFKAVKTIFALIPDFSTTEIAEDRLSDWFHLNENITEEIKSKKIVLSDVSFCYNENPILEHVSVTFDSSKLTLIKGNNGEGKSTLFRLITNLCVCNSGKISVGEIDSASLAEQNYPNKIFFLPQDDPAFHFTAQELYEMILQEQITEVWEIASRFHLTVDLLSSKKISELSGGERKKVFLCLGFALKPQIMLLDEPTNSLDEAGKEILKQLLKERNNGAVIISHENLFDDIAEEVYVLKNGGVCIEKER